MPTGARLKGDTLKLEVYRYVFMFLQLLLTVPLLFSIFPQTKSLAYLLLSYIWEPIRSILVGIVSYIPNLFTIFVIYMAIRYLVRLGPLSGRRSAV